MFTLNKQGVLAAKNAITNEEYINSPKTAEALHDFIIELNESIHNEALGEEYIDDIAFIMNTNPEILRREYDDIFAELDEEDEDRCYFHEL